MMLNNIKDFVSKRTKSNRSEDPKQELDKNLFVAITPTQDPNRQRELLRREALLNRQKNN